MVETGPQRGGWVQELSDEYKTQNGQPPFPGQKSTLHKITNKHFNYCFKHVQQKKLTAKNHTKDT